MTPTADDLYIAFNTVSGPDEGFDRMGGLSFVIGRSAWSPDGTRIAFVRHRWNQ